MMGDSGWSVIEKQIKGVIMYKTQNGYINLKNLDALDAFERQYLETALWSSTDNSDDSGGEPLDANYDITDIAPDSVKAMLKDCSDFRELAAKELEKLNDDSQAGHDFWLTRNGHGAGFWDRGNGALGDKLTELAESFGSSDLYVGDDGKLYVS